MRSLQRQNQLKQERFTLQTRMDNQQSTRCLQEEKLNSMWQQSSDFESKLAQMQLQISRLEVEKKDLAQNRKFKEASACQAQIKQLQQQSADSRQASEQLSADALSLREQLASKQSEAAQMQTQLQQLEQQVDTEHLHNYLSH